MTESPSRAEMPGRATPKEVGRPVTRRDEREVLFFLSGLLVVLTLVAFTLGTSAV